MKTMIENENLSKCGSSFNERGQKECDTQCITICFFYNVIKESLKAKRQLMQHLCVLSFAKS